MLSTDMLAVDCFMSDPLYVVHRYAGWDGFMSDPLYVVHRYAGCGLFHE